MRVPAPMKLFIKHYPETTGGIVFNENIEGEIEESGKKIKFLHFSKVPDIMDI